MTPRLTLFAGLQFLGLQLLQGVTVDVDVEDESVCLLQDATALLHDVIRTEKDESEASSPRGTAVKASWAPKSGRALGLSHHGGLGSAVRGKGGGGAAADQGYDSDVSEPSTLQVLSVMLFLPLAGLATYILSKQTFMRTDEHHYEQQQLQQTQAHYSRPSIQSDAGSRYAADNEMRKNESMSEDTFSFAISSMTRDAQLIAKGHPKSSLFIARCAFALGLLFSTIGIQLGLVVQVKLWVTPQQVDSIRGAYDAYELHMYGGVESHTTLTRNGKHRGIPGYFQPELFETLDDDLKGEVCNIPLSRLSFFGMVLAVWSLTCMVQLKKACSLFWNLIIVTPTISSMSDCIVAADTDEDEPGRGDMDAMCPTTSLKLNSEQYLYGDNVVIVGLTATVKSMIVMGVILPWIGVTGFLLWLGCRWLTATNDFGNLISNAVALEFILYLKDLMYTGLVSDRNKRELQNTKILPDSKRQRAGYMVYLGTLLWFLAVMGWLWAYIFHLQRVLPEYRWDVKEVCTEWYAGLLAKPA